MNYFAKLSIFAAYCNKKFLFFEENVNSAWILGFVLVITRRRLSRSYARAFINYNNQFYIDKQKNKHLIDCFQITIIFFNCSSERGVLKENIIITNREVQQLLISTYLEDSFLLFKFLHGLNIVKDVL